MLVIDDTAIIINSSMLRSTRRSLIRRSSPDHGPGRGSVRRLTDRLIAEETEKSAKVVKFSGAKPD
jgi:hypothetical protein